MQVMVLRYETFKQQIALTKQFVKKNYRVENLGCGILMVSRSVELI